MISNPFWAQFLKSTIKAKWEMSVLYISALELNRFAEMIMQRRRRTQMQNNSTEYTQN